MEQRRGVMIEIRKIGGITLAVLLAAVLAGCGGGGSAVKNTSGPGGAASAVSSNRGQADGVATIYDNDYALARDRAIEDAKSTLVKQVLGTTIEGTSIMKDYEMVEMIVKSKSIGLVKNDRIIKEWQDKDAAYVRIEGTVEPTVVEDAIADILRTYGHPKFMVLIQETFEGKQNMPGFTETELKIQEIMGNSGYEFVDAAMTRDLMKRDQKRMTSAMNGNVSGDVQELLLNDLGAEVIIIGITKTNDQTAVLKSMSANMKSKRALIQLKAIDVYTGNILATSSENAPGADIDSDAASKKAIENAFKKILGRTDPATSKFKAGPFLNTVSQKFVEGATNRQINILVTGLDYNGITKFRNEVEQRVRGVKSVTNKGQEGKAARLEVRFAGKTDEFAGELIAKAPNLGFNVKVTSSYPNKLVLSASQTK